MSKNVTQEKFCIGGGMIVSFANFLWIEKHFSVRGCIIKICFLYLHRFRIKHAIIAQLVERWLPKPKVAGSSPVYRSSNRGDGSFDCCNQRNRPLR